VPLAPHLHEGPRGRARKLRPERSGRKPGLGGGHPRETGPMLIVPEVFRKGHLPCPLHCFGGPIQEHAEGLGPSVPFGQAFHTRAGRCGFGGICRVQFIKEGRPNGKKALSQFGPQLVPRANQNQARAKRLRMAIYTLAAGR
jgi:hypothetical protein